MTTDTKARLEQVREMLRLRTDMKGQPLPGYKSNVEAVRSEIERLEALDKQGMLK